MKPWAQIHINYVDNMVQGLDPEDFKELVNGCGSEKFALKWFKFPRKWCEIFRPHCNWHDIGYYIGGKDRHRNVVDFEFYMRMMREAGLNPSGQFWALVGWRAVHRLGQLSFEKRMRPAKLDYLKLVAHYKRATRENR